MALKFWRCRELYGHWPPWFHGPPITPHWPFLPWMTLKPWYSCLHFLTTMIITGMCYRACLRWIQLHLVSHDSDGMSKMKVALNSTGKPLISVSLAFSICRTWTELCPSPLTSCNRLDGRQWSLRQEGRQIINEKWKHINILIQCD